jgi:hypothetical protein
VTRSDATARLAGVVTLLAAWLATAAVALAASPTPDPIVGDPRSSGQGPGLVGDPLFALLVVVAIGFGSVIATLAYVRLTARRDR